MVDAVKEVGTCLGLREKQGEVHCVRERKEGGRGGKRSVFGKFDAPQWPNLLGDR